MYKVMLNFGTPTKFENAELANLKTSHPQILLPLLEKNMVQMRHYDTFRYVQKEVHWNLLAHLIAK